MLCVIPARIGSKRLARKNLKLLAGWPMVAWSIKAAKDSRLFDEVFVATESGAVAHAARQHGACVPTLVPLERCGDKQASHAPCLWLIDCDGLKDDSLLCLQPSSPLRTAEDILAAAHIFGVGGYDFVVSVTKIDPHYFHWAVKLEGSDHRMWFRDEFMKPREELPEVLRPNGSIKIAKIDKLREVGHFFGPNLGVVHTPEDRSIHVATQFDFDVAEFLLKRRQQCEG